MARNVEKSDAPPLLGEGLEVRLNKYLDCLFTGVNLNANRRIAKVNLVASSVLSSNDGVRHYDFGIDGCAIITRWRSADEPKRGLVAAPSE
jgi:hypothetical protein